MNRVAEANAAGVVDRGLGLRVIDHRPYDVNFEDDEDPGFTVRQWLIQDVAAALAESEVRLVRLSTKEPPPVTPPAGARVGFWPSYCLPVES